MYTFSAAGGERESERERERERGREGERERGREGERERGREGERERGRERETAIIIYYKPRDIESRRRYHLEDTCYAVH